MRNLSVTEACKQKGFFCELDDNNEIHLTTSRRAPRVAVGKNSSSNERVSGDTNTVKKGNIKLQMETAMERIER